MDISEELFREHRLFSREDVLRSLGLFIAHEKANEDPVYPPGVVSNRVKLCEKFYAAVKKCKLPARS